MAVIIRSTHIDDGLAGAIKAGIQAAIGVQAQQAEVIVATVVTVTRHNDLAIALYGNALASIARTTHSDDGDSNAVKAGVQAAIGVQAHQAEVIIAAVVAVTGHNDLAIALHGDALAALVPTTHRDDGLAGAVVAGVQAAVGVQAHQAEGGVDAVEAEPRHNDLAITLHGDAVAGIVQTTQIDDGLAGAHRRCKGGCGVHRSDHSAGRVAG